MLEKRLERISTMIGWEADSITRLQRSIEWVKNNSKYTEEQKKESNLIETKAIEDHKQEIRELEKERQKIVSSFWYRLTQTICKDKKWIYDGGWSE